MLSLPFLTNLQHLLYVNWVTGQYSLIFMMQSGNVYGQIWFWMRQICPTELLSRLRNTKSYYPKSKKVSHPQVWLISCVGMCLYSSFVPLIRDFQVISSLYCILCSNDVTHVGITENYYLDKSLCTLWIRGVETGKCKLQ